MLNSLRNGANLTVLAGLICLLAGCENKSKYNYGYGVKSPDDIKFRDSVSTNADVPANASELKFVDTNGQPVTI